MLTASRAPIPVVVQQHQEESASLRATRESLVRAPHVRLHHLRRLDDRIAAHLDGLAVAGEFGSGLCEAALESPGIGEVFAATVRAIEDRNAAIEWWRKRSVELEASVAEQRERADALAAQLDVLRHQSFLRRLFSIRRARDLG